MRAADNVITFEEGSPSSLDFAEEKEELERVLNHPEISRSANLVRFLTFICDKYFEGKTGEIREYSIALEALGRRGSDFDPHSDPIVRVTARTLRKKLGEFYENEGKNHLLQIELPLGHYIPQFVRRPVQSDEANGLNIEELGYIDNIHPQDERSSNNSVYSASIEDIDGETERVSSVRSAPVSRKTVWRFICLAIVLLIVFWAGLSIGRLTDARPSASPQPIAWGEPVWSDEFNGAAQQLPDASKWTYDTSNQDGWGNHELETYCSPEVGFREGCDPLHPNAFQDGEGHLVLRAARGADGRWTSARVTTRELKSFQYGRIEARMKLPVGRGLWPAFWMLGANFPIVGWPSSGSVDFVENVSPSSRFDGLGPTMVRSTLHGPHYFGGNGLWHDFKFPNGGRVDDGNFHIYGAIWSPGMIQFYVDNPANVFCVRDSSDIPEGGEWVFNHPFYLVMDLAVGGDWPGSPDGTTPNPSEVLVDYVRVYKIPHVPAPSIWWQDMQIKAGSSTTSILGLRARDFIGRVHVSCSTEPATAVCALGTSVVDFSDTLSQEDTLTISTNSLTNNGEIVEHPGRYKLTITATTISGDHSQITTPFDVNSSNEP